MSLLIHRIFLAILLILPLQSISQCVTVYPYTESFETGMGNWFSGGTNNDWAWTTPVKPTITGAGAGVKCWVTGGAVASFYNLGERSWVKSPCFDFTNVDKPYISFLVFWETERTYDGGNIQYSVDGGTTWITIGVVNETDTCSTNNWYNVSHINNLSQLTQQSQGWSGTIQSGSGSCNGGGGSGGWKRASHCLEFLAHEPSVLIRFTFGAGTTCNDYDGFAFDDIYIGEGPSLSADFDFLCQGNNVMDFNDPFMKCHDSWNWNFGDPTSSTNTSARFNPTHTFTQGGVYNVTLSVTGGCSPDTVISKTISILSYSVVTDSVTCDGGNDGSVAVTVQNTSGPVSYNWSHNATLNAPVANNLGVGHYSVHIADTFCSVDVDADVYYSPNAQSGVSLGDDTTICPGTFFALVPGNFLSYLWQDNSTDSFYVVRTNGNYSVQVKTITGCLSSDTVSIIEDCMNDILLPNAFTPNGDGINEMFFANGSGTADFEIFIYNRWGVMIFSSPDRSIGWDGTIDGHPVQEGFYNYLVNYSIGNEERVKTGSVLVIR